MCNTKTRLTFLALVATFTGLSTAVQAQNIVTVADMSVRPLAAGGGAAEAMEERAYRMVLDGSGWDQAAGLYVRAAALRGSTDLKSAENMRLAGYIHYYRERTPAAVLALTEAGQAYLALGDVERAADTFIDGAWVAAQAGMTSQALDLSERATLLTRSPLLQEAERFALVRRLGPVPGAE